MPFLRNVTRGRGVPEERLAAVAEHYYHFGGVSPINAQNRELITAIEGEFRAAGLDTPIYWGNRNWAPYLADTVRQMRDDGVRRAAAFVTAAYASYSSCGQYLDDIATAQAVVSAERGSAPRIVKLGHYYDHPGFLAPHTDAVRTALKELSAPSPRTTRLVFTAHSIPLVMSAASGTGDSYEKQLRAVAATVAASAAPELEWELVWQSRSGPPSVPWLEPDINDHLTALAQRGVTDVAVSPIGFVSDHLEVKWDLDTEAAAAARRLGLRYVRAATPGADPRFVSMVRELFLAAVDEPLDSVAVSEPGCCGGGCCGRAAA